MEEADSLPCSPGAAAQSPLQPMTPDRVNQQRDSYFGSPRSSHARDSSIHDKIQAFNNLSRLGPGSAANMSKQLERKTADAALKRAMLGREEAESDLRRYREEARLLRKQIEEGKERERRVGERLETVMENYGRAKETYSHTQAIWEKEIRRARKETFKSQSNIVKLQEELKAAKAATKSKDEVLQREKERSQAREQEAFTARYELVGVQEQLQQALERVKVIEQERDAFKTLAQNEEVARIAAEGRLPLPKAEDSDDEFASPKKIRLSLTTADIASSAASEAEIDELTDLWQWERQRANRAQEHIEFLEAECQLRCCPCTKSRLRRSLLGSARKSRPEPIAILDPSDLAILGQKAASPPTLSPAVEGDTVIHQPSIESPTEESDDARSFRSSKETKEPRRSTIFIPSEGTFRTVSQTELDAMQSVEESPIEPMTPADPTTPADPVPAPMHYARTPSVDPPTFALIAAERERTSLMSLLNAPCETNSAVLNIPTTPGDTVMGQEEPEHSDAVVDDARPNPSTEDEANCRPHTSAAFYTVTQTTTVPIVEKENVDPRSYAMTGRRNQVRGPSFDKTNPALTPTMTREQALAQIRERRGRARSAAQGAATPRKQMVAGGGERRDVSAPAGRAGKGRS
ncbi:hypothetical protein JX265_003121 [Neoarthrinium moseri]|uniref:Uncharacterized protein n=1 Tax=Neoarthrinium moseri TaxID=1658444 RepID=A0A9P9WTQ2_9PEZI|nr:hypothetical protein JX266_002175 [Neoarthrinium moseri]KAI1878944.1 hypothetical protein JX265_003121 [Neoarthrinium moseri]